MAAPCLVLPGPFQRFAEGRQVRLANRHDFAWLVARIRSGPPPGFFRIGWVRSFPSLNEFFVHHEDVRRANRLGPRTLTHDLEATLWRNVRRASRYLSRRLSEAGLEIEWPGSGEPHTVRQGKPTARLSGTARRAAPLCVRAAGRGPRGGQRARRSGSGDSSHALRHVNRSPRTGAGQQEGPENGRRIRCRTEETARSTDFAPRIAPSPRGCSSEAEHQLPKLRTRVRFSSPALLKGPGQGPCRRLGPRSYPVPSRVHRAGGRRANDGWRGARTSRGRRPPPCRSPLPTGPAPFRPTRSVPTRPGCSVPEPDDVTLGPCITFRDTLA